MIRVYPLRDSHTAIEFKQLFCYFFSRDGFQWISVVLLLEILLPCRLYSEYICIHLLIWVLLVQLYQRLLIGTVLLPAAGDLTVLWLAPVSLIRPNTNHS